MLTLEVVKIVKMRGFFTSKVVNWNLLNENLKLKFFGSARASKIVQF